MNLAGKIFIVLNLLLSVAFAVACSSLYAKRVDWVDQASKYLTEWNAQTKKLNTKTEELAKLQEEFTSAKGISTTTITLLETSQEELRNDHNGLKGTYNTLSNNLASVTENIADMKTTLASVETAKQNLETDLKKANIAKDKAIRDRDYERRRAIEAVADLNEAESELESHNTRLASLMEQNIEIRITLEKFRKRYGSIATVAQKTPVVPVRGKVLRVREEVDLVMINLGEKDKLTTGMELVISRGSEYIGKVKISTLYDNMASAIIDPGMTIKPIRKGDTAETL